MKLLKPSQTTNITTCSDNVIILYFAQSSLFTAVYPLAKVDLVISVHQMHSCVFCGHTTYILMTMAIINLSMHIRRILHSFVSHTTSFDSFIFVCCHKILKQWSCRIIYLEYRGMQRRRWRMAESFFLAQIYSI